MQVCLNHSRCPTADTATDFVKEQYLGVYKSFYDFASRYYGIYNLLTVSQVNPAAYKALYPIHVFDVLKQSERLIEGVVDLTVKMEFSANVPADTQAYARLILDGTAIEMEHNGEVVVVRRFIYNCQEAVLAFNPSPPFYLKNGRDCELAMVNLETYYSFANIGTDNNSLKWSGDGGTAWALL